MATLEAGTTPKKPPLSGTISLKGISGTSYPILQRNQQTKGEDGEGARICKDSLVKK